MGGASLYPDGIDNDVNLGRVDATTLITPASHNNLVDALESIEVALGVNPQGTHADVATRFSSLGGGGSSGEVSWNAAALVNGWVAYGATYAAAGYLKDGVGVVHLRGLIKSGTVATGTVLFTLPAGYRPSADAIFVAANGAGVPTWITVSASSGVVTLGSNAGGNAWQSLEGISFSTV